MHAFHTQQYFPWNLFRFESLYQCLCLHQIFYIFSRSFFLALIQRGLFMLLYKHFLDFRCALCSLFSWCDSAEKECSVCCCCWCCRRQLVCYICWIISKNSLIRAFYLQHIRFLIACLLFRSSSSSTFSRIHRFYYFIILAIERLARSQKH